MFSTRNIFCWSIRKTRGNQGVVPKSNRYLSIGRCLKLTLKLTANFLLTLITLNFPCMINGTQQTKDLKDRIYFSHQFLLIASDITFGVFKSPVRTKLMLNIYLTKHVPHMLNVSWYFCLSLMWGFKIH